MVVELAGVLDVSPEGRTWDGGNNACQVGTTNNILGFGHQWFNTGLDVEAELVLLGIRQVTRYRHVEKGLEGSAEAVIDDPYASGAIESSVVHGVGGWMTIGVNQEASSSRDGSGGDGIRVEPEGVHVFEVMGYE